MAYKVFDKKSRADKYAEQKNKKSRVFVYVVRPYYNGWIVYHRRKGR